MGMSDLAVHRSSAAGSPGQVRVAVDAMGGDYAPTEIVRGAMQASCAAGVHVLLVGDPDRVNEELKRTSCRQACVSVIPASDLITMGEKPTQAFRSKPDASITVAMRLLAEAKADALISAGNTGAMVTSACLILGRLEGIERPAITAVIPTPTGRIVLLDAGANLDVGPQHLLHFALMGTAFARCALGVHDPRIGLLNVGAEASKGSNDLREAYSLLSNSAVNFVGNVEGGDITGGKADVIVCDGYVGNVVLKHSEGWSKAVLKMLRSEVGRNPLAWPGYLPLAIAASRLQARLGSTHYGGAVLLGVRGLCVKSRGNSRAAGVRNAVAAAVSLVKSCLMDRVRQELAMQRPPPDRTGDPSTCGPADMTRERR